MDTIRNRINAFVELGKFLSQFTEQEIKKKDTVLHNELFFDGFKHQIKLAEENNSWFTKESILFTLKNWSNVLTETNLKNWLSEYNISKINSKKIALILAGNIPLVGFHDFLSVLISGNSAIVKQSNKDKHLLPYLAKYLEYVLPDLKSKIFFTEEKLTDFDAVIATGSNNTSRYFEYYFRNKANIIRKNRNSVAVLTGNETEKELHLLADDIFTYFGLGCRSVSKIFVPKNYNFDFFFNGIYHKHSIINNNKYANNYDYNKTVYLMSEFDILENGFLLLKEDNSYASPIASIFYEHYTSKEELQLRLNNDSENIQCIVSSSFGKNTTAFGQTQHPKLNDYADGVDTLGFLLNLK